MITLKNILTRKGLTKIDIEKSFEEIIDKKVNHIELSMSTHYLHFSYGSGPNYEISVKNNLFESSKVRIDVRKSKFGYNINRLLYVSDGGGIYEKIGFSFSKHKADNKAYKYALRMAQEISEKFNVELIDKSQEDFRNVRKKVAEMQKNLKENLKKSSENKKC